MGSISGAAFNVNQPLEDSNPIDATDLHESQPDVVETFSNDESVVIRNGDIAIAVLGATGSGKSAFINRVAGNQVAPTGNGLASCTQDVRAYKCRHPTDNRHVILVDTPGSDSGGQTYLAVLNKVENWIHKTYKQRIVLSGILQIHNIYNKKMHSLPFTGLRPLANLCGSLNSERLIILTTFWDLLENEIETGERREEELKKFWKDLISTEAPVYRFEPNTRSRSWEIVDLFRTGAYLIPKSPITQGWTDVIRQNLNLIIAERQVNDQFNTDNQFNDLGVVRIQNGDKVIAVMGPSGCGKSSFINIVARKQMAPTGEGLKSCTQEVRAYKCEHPEDSRHVILLDTPGFDNSGQTYLTVVKNTAKWIFKTYRQKIVLSGILQLHNIYDKKMHSLPITGLETLSKLCGAKVPEKLVILTTFWDLVDEEIGQTREHELRETVWKDLISRSTPVLRLDIREPLAASVWDIVDRFRDGVHVTTPRQLIMKDHFDHWARIINTIWGAGQGDSIYSTEETSTDFDTESGTTSSRISSSREDGAISRRIV